MKKVKIITIILAIILVTLVAFGGVYVKTQNRMENKVKDYTFGREIAGGRVIELKVATGEDEESKQNPEILTTENYEIVKKTIEKRLEYLGAQDYTISLNKEDGTIRVELAEDDLTDTYAYFLNADGSVQIKDEEAGTELLSDSMIEKTKYSYTADAEGKYQIFMELYLTEEGQAKIEEIQNEYAVLASEIEEIEAAQSSDEDEEDHDHDHENEENVSEENTTTETTENEEASKKTTQLTIAGSEYDIEKIEENKIRVNIGSATSNSTYVNNYINVAAELALLINSGKYPVEYEIESNRYIYSDITEKQLIYFAIAVAIIMLISFIILVIKYKMNGALVSVSYIGFVSILMLVLRYTNVSISIEGIAGIIISLIINYIVSQAMLEKNTDYKNLVLKLMPIVIIALVFSFAGWVNLSSFGMIMFWGLALIAIYNYVVTKTLLKLRESK